MKEDLKEEIKTLKEEQTIKKETILIFTAISMVVILVLLVVGVKFYEPEEKAPTLVYHGFMFEQKAGFWHFNWQADDGRLYTVSLRFNPEEAAKIPLKGESIAKFNEHLKNSNIVYIAFDPTADNFTYTALAAGELSLSIARALEITPVAACTVNETEACISRPIVSCNSTDKAVIYLDDDEDEPKIVQKDNCLIISGRGFEKLRAADRVLYHWYKVY